MPIAYITLTVQKKNPTVRKTQLQFVLKMAAYFTDTSTQLNTPLSHCSIDNEVTPLFHQTLLQ